MKIPLLKPLLPFALMLSAILGLTSCLEESTVVKIKKDGSGLIHVRKYENTLAGKGLFGELGGGEEKEEQKVDAPNEEELQARATAMGEGVSLKSFRRGKNKSGWTGYEAIYAFEDINKVRLDLNTKNVDDMKRAEDGSKDPDKVDAGAAELVTFEMTDGRLKIRTPDPSAQEKGGKNDKEEQNDSGEGARDPFADGPDDPQMMAMMAAIFAGAKVGFFVEIDGEITETDAKHREGKMITIMRADLGKLFANPEAMKKLEGMDGNNREEVQKIVDSLEGVDMDLQDPITVKIK